MIFIKQLNTAKYMTLMMINLKSVKNLNKLVNHDMKQSKYWLGAKKISLNVENLN